MAVIKLDKQAFFHNLDELTKLCGKDKLAVVLKDNAYGHGIVEIAGLAHEFGIKWAVVRSSEEAVLISRFFENILILADQAKSDQFHYAINSLEQLEVCKNAKIHLKIDSGMHRNGLSHDQLQTALDLVVQNGCELAGVFSHMRSADQLSSELFWQEQNFNKSRKIVEDFCLSNGIKKPLFHLYNSSALIRQKTIKDYDLARCGIAIYGYADFDSIFDKPNLKPVLSLYAQKIATRELARGQKAGYSGAFTADWDMVVSTYDIGYGDGFLRLDGTENYTTANGKKVLGRVSMDNMMIESDQDEICVLNNAEKLAKARGTISYEVLVRLNPLIRREIV